MNLPPPGSPLEGDSYLTGQIELTRRCAKESADRPTRQVYDPTRGWVLLVCRSCGHSRRATVIGAREWRRPGG